MSAPENAPRTPPYKAAGAVLLVILAAVTTMIYFQFRGDFTPKTRLIMIASRAGLVMDPGSKVTFNGVEIGRVADVGPIDQNGTPKAEIGLDIEPRYLKFIPANVAATINATTVFGNKYIAFRSPPQPVPQRISSKDVIDVSAVTTEFNTVFETVVQLAEQIDPVKVNQTLTAAAQGLQGLGEKFGESLVNANRILDDVNQRMPQFRYDTKQFADLAQVYADASPDLWDALRSAVTTARTFNDQRSNLDSALMASIGISNTGADIFERGGPYLVRGAEDLVPTSALLQEYSPELFCMIRNYANVAPKVRNILGDNGYSLRSAGTAVGAGNPYVYPDNLPRLNAHGGPEGRPGCWQNITHDLWPAPYLVMDTGYSSAPYNHFGINSPLFPEYVWGRQFGELTINP
jgi:phospholipid/cholesterol/gamma-HCH transport system substrate-binding protein